MRRLHSGQPIRDAMKRQDMSIPRLAERTREVDPEGRGISQALVGFYVATGKSGRESATDRTAYLIAAALGFCPGAFFADEESATRQTHASHQPM